jgi:hypothetical protein
MDPILPIHLDAQRGPGVRSCCANYVPIHWALQGRASTKTQPGFEEATGGWASPQAHAGPRPNTTGARFEYGPRPNTTAQALRFRAQGQHGRPTLAPARAHKRSPAKLNKSFEQGLSLSRSYQQGHSTAYSTPFGLSRLQRIQPREPLIVCSAADSRDIPRHQRVR